MNTVPNFPTIAEASDLIARGEITPVDLTQHCLSRIAAQDGVLHSFLTFTGEQALQAAEQATAEIRSGQYKGPLHGIPVGIKDIFDTAGVRTTGNSRLLEERVPSETAESVKRLEAAGAIVLGKLTTHEFALGGPSFDLPWPPARNPWDKARFTGGSSSGTGAAVAAGLVLAGTGSDTGGSIRNPAAYCGITGLKPTYGLVSRRGVIPLAFSLDHVGPMAWNAEDCAIMLQAMAGFDARDPGSASVAIPDYRQALATGVAGLRVGIIRHFHEEDRAAEPAMLAAFEDAVHVLTALGCKVSEARLSPLSQYAACGNVIMLSEAYAIHEQDLRDRPDMYGYACRARMSIGAMITAADYLRAQRRRTELVAETAAAMHQFDVLLTVTAASEAPEITQVGPFGSYEKPLYTMPANVTGSPTISVCCGYSANGLPLGMQMSGRPFDDATVLRLAHAYETATAWRGKRPQVM
ncbi:Asp-tRNA(Asn)/Glu-tRNA(Gln) amidotransferase subunit GatA [Acidisoma cellulosilytica]|uniref:Asp-tRNA(Asn)/Glu-tRNA(Gln) amidotransferase subunit GatA n=1 Tax=Acidisoma cellulosilyticum TaxID=2802395 RepID=A0A963Z5W4_9PROT|nr:amidase [Acidisoma cellulosilyticum]MCB8883183.1 Asp-tRNA(Asn)/Glu-tRNA(Gln) amidotransferase subunit GatA [Acidisoma cellulosilyticum]